MLGTAPLWRLTVAFTYLKVKSAKCLNLFTSGGLGLVILVLFLRIWSCLHHWTAVQWVSDMAERRSAQSRSAWTYVLCRWQRGARWVSARAGRRGRTPPRASASCHAVSSWWPSSCWMPPAAPLSLVSSLCGHWLPQSINQSYTSLSQICQLERSCVQAGDNRDCHTACSGGHWRHFYLDSETTAQCELF